MRSTIYSEINRLRCTGNVTAAVELLKSQPPQSDEDAFEAVACLFIAGDIDSAAYVCQTRAWKVAWARQTSEALVKLLVENNVQEALTLARMAIREPDVGPDAKAFFLMLLQANSRLDEALTYAREQPMPPTREPFLLTMMAEIFSAGADWMHAYQFACAVIATDAENYRALMVLSHANFAFKNYHESLGNALCANQISRGSLPATLQIMRCQNRLGDHYAAIAAFGTLASPDASQPDVSIELGMAYAGLDCAEKATAAYLCALSATPPPMEAIRALLKIHIDAGDNAALSAFSTQFGDAMASDVDCILLLGLEHLRRGP